MTTRNDPLLPDSRIDLRKCFQDQMLIRLHYTQIKTAEERLVAKRDEMDSAEISSLVSSIKFSQHVITAYQFQKIREAEESGE